MTCREFPAGKLLPNWGCRVSNADRIGLPSFLGWLVNSGPWTALAITWVLTPLMLYIIRYVLESDMIFKHYNPWSQSFRGFMPGDLFLGGAFGSAVALSDRLDDRSHWYNSSTWHIIVFVGAVAGAVLARKFLDAPMYTKRQMRSPSKLYHDVLLYVGYGYLLFTVAMAGLVGVSGFGWEKILMVVCLIAWLSCLVYDQAVLTPRQRKSLARTSHDGWYPIWGLK